MCPLWTYGSIERFYELQPRSGISCPEEFCCVSPILTLLDFRSARFQDVQHQTMRGRITPLILIGNWRRRLAAGDAVTAGEYSFQDAVFADCIRDACRLFVMTATLSYPERQLLVRICLNAAVISRARVSFFRREPGAAYPISISAALLTLYFWCNFPNRDTYTR